MKHRAVVRLEVFDLLGRKVRTLVEGELAEGPHRAEWLGTDQSGLPAASGIYFVRFSGKGFDFCDKVVLMK